MIKADEKTESRLRKINDYLSHMPSLSTTSTKVLEICNRPNSSPNDLNRVISLDPVLTGRVLKLINSAYHYIPREVTSLTRAIILLGFNTVKNLALSMVVLNSLGGEESCRAFSMDDFWTHSLCVGVTAKSIAAAMGTPVTRWEEHFVAGLLHDLGKIPISCNFPDDFCKVLELAEAGHVSFYQAESVIFGTDHCVVGGIIADKWKLGDTINESLCHHHNPVKANKEFSQLVAIVALGNIYSKLIEAESSGDIAPEEPMTNYLLEKVGISWDKLSGLKETIADEIEKARIFLEIAQKN